MKKLVQSLLLGTFLVYGGSSAHAQILLGWDFSSSGLNYTDPNTGYGGPAIDAFEGAGVQSSSITKTGWVDVFSGTNISSPSTGAMSTAGWSQSSFSAAEGAIGQGFPSAGPFTFTVTPKAGATLQITGLDLGTFYNGTPGTYFIASSLDNYSSPLATFTANGSTEWDASLNLQITSPVTFQIYGYGFGGFNRYGIGGVSLADGQGYAVELLGSQVTGGAAVPEPATGALLVLSGVLLLALRLRSRAALR